MIYFQTHLVVIAVVVVVLTAVVAYLCVMGARRLDRLHQRILANRDALSRLLVRRASETLLLAREDALGARARLEALDATCYRIQLARSAHNTDVTQVRSLRGTALVRVFHLAGHAPEPEPIDFDDDTRYDGRGY